jgi:hypothetical protein
MWAWAAVAEAQQERCVPAPVFDLETRVAEVDAAFSRGDAPAGRELLGAAHALARCVVRPIPAPLMARLASLEALGAHLDQDPDAALRWARAAEWSEPRHAWPASIGTAHPVRAALLAEGAPAVGPARKRGLRLPRDGAAVLSGRLLTEAEAPVDVPVLLQLCDHTGAVVFAEWQEGTTFPDEVLKGGGPATPPSWWK